MTTIALTILSIIPVLIICTSLYFTNRRVDKMTNAMKELYSDLQHHDMIINYALADDIREIKEELKELKELKEQLDAYKLELHPYANDPKNPAN